MTQSNVLDQSAPDDSVYTLLGAVNFTWAQLDQISSGAYASLLKVDPIEFGITIGRIETQAKIGKMHSIARHRRDKKRAATLAEIKKTFLSCGQLETPSHAALTWANRLKVNWL